MNKQSKSRSSFWTRFNGGRNKATLTDCPPDLTNDNQRVSLNDTPSLNNDGTLSSLKNDGIGVRAKGIHVGLNPENAGVGSIHPNRDRPSLEDFSAKSSPGGQSSRSLLGTSSKSLLSNSSRSLCAFLDKMENDGRKLEEKMEKSRRKSYSDSKTKSSNSKRRRCYRCDKCRKLLRNELLHELEKTEKKIGTFDECSPSCNRWGEDDEAI